MNTALVSCEETRVYREGGVNGYGKHGNDFNLLEFSRELTFPWWPKSKNS